MIDKQSIVVDAFTRRNSSWLSIDEILFSRYVNMSAKFRGQLHGVEMAPCRLKTCTFLYAFMLRSIPHDACSRLCGRDSAWAGVFSRSSRSSA